MYMSLIMCIIKRLLFASWRNKSASKNGDGDY